jgi:PAS domain S-box-containing protein
MPDQIKNTDFDSAVVQWLNDYAPQGILTTDTSFVIRGWNRWLEQSTGLTSESVVGKSLLDVFPELVERRLDQSYHEALNGKVTLLSQRFHRYLLKLAARPEYGFPEMQQSALIAPLKRDGQIVGTITAIEDVSERVARENQLIAEREAADQANEAKDRFLSVLSHDLRTPLTAILGWARVFQMRSRDEETINKGAAVIERNVAVQLELIEEILDISRISTAKLELNIESVNVRAATIMTLEMLEPIAVTKGVRLDSAMPGQDRNADLDSKRFQQILWNLVSNAVKFTPAGGSVRVTLTYHDCGLELSIADTGKGIDAENLGHVFDPLWQAEASGRQGGLGLGLTIVKNLVELHGGCIRAESSGPGSGATFIVEIPWLRLQTCKSGAGFYSNSQRD